MEWGKKKERGRGGKEKKVKERRGKVFASVKIKS